MEFWKVILASSVVSGIVTWIANSWISNQNYRREYFKQLISKRLQAYQIVETVCARLAASVSDEVAHLHPEIFSSRVRYMEFFAVLCNAISQSVWLGNETSDILQRINYALLNADLEFKLQTEECDFVGAGKAYRAELVDLKDKLFSQLRKDFRSLHHIDAFIKT